jgi:hypothetical protein
MGLKSNKRGLPSKSKLGGGEKSSRRLTYPAINLVKQLDSVFSKVVRQRDTDEYNRCTCISCGKKVPWQKIHAGHYVSRFVMQRRWDERNVWPQCATCNMDLDGNLGKYRLALIDKFGEEEMLRIEDYKSDPIPTNDNRRDLLEQYTLELKSITDGS